jgi:hypothetical protein
MPQSSGSATLTGRTGPGVLMTAIPAPNLRIVTLDFTHSVMHVEFVNANGEQSVDLDMILTTTLTDTIATLIHTIVTGGS